VCDTKDICEGYDDTRDWDKDGTPDGCDPDPACTDCTPDENGLVTICWIPFNQDNMKSVKGDCEYIQNFFAKEGRLKGKSQCGPCTCAMIGDKDSDGDGVCDRKDECPMNPELSKTTTCGCELLTDPCDDDGDGIKDYDDNCPNIPNAPCTTDDQYDEMCNCIGTESDSDNDGVCDALDKCQGFSDSYDADSDGIPDGCDVQEKCGSCQPDNQGRIIICKLTVDKRNFVNIAGKCKDLSFLYDENGNFLSDLYSCGQCTCEMIGDKDSDGDGICDRKDKD